MAQRGAEAPEIGRPHTIRIIGANLRRLRVTTGEYGPQMTQREVATKAGLGHNLVSMLEKSRDPAEPLAPAPTTTTLDALAQVFGVEVAELFRWDSGTSWYLTSPSAKLQVLPGGAADSLMTSRSI